MDKYKRLFSNTMLFAISNFSSKMLTLFLKPMYSRVVDDADFGLYSNAWSYIILLLPLVCLGMDYAVLRFGLDKRCGKAAVFTNSLGGLAAGFVLLAACYPLMRMLPNCEGYMTAIYVMLLVSNLRRLCAQFVRAKELPGAAVTLTITDPMSSSGSKPVLVVFIIQANNATAQARIPQTR